MNKTARASLALAAGLAVAAVASNQTRSRTPAPAVSPATPVPSTVLTPGTGGLTPRYPTSSGSRVSPVFSSTTPGYGSNLYSIPDTTPSGMPTYGATPLTTPVTGNIGTAAKMVTATPKRPTTAADCAQDGWQSYSGLGFTSQKGCEAWVKRHPTGSSGATAGTKKIRTTAPAPKASPRAASPMEATSPGSSITPLLNPTPIPR